MEVSDLYEHLKDDLLRFARSIARHEYEADDLVQDGLEKALTETELVNLSEYKQRAWFFRVMKNKLIDDRRKEKRLTWWNEELDFSIREVALTHMEMTELLGYLSPEASDMVFKRYWIGLSSREIGKQLELPAASVRYKLHQAIKKLRKIVEEDS
ncbi:RNA polymerase sigma factor [Lentibacillus sp. CBA3610]|uniref:RNA polymerase sigma factor n=1 Tax=Lentibacillus sp. CBA3610 TaxID=2518176 RepID=UPI0015963978|nr:RNA polymerase sigma factor [Lentibacillus sp. CBA3610]QKY70756.1 RNA polymerase sigma factor [Lentibacillus sp. CBA3610]